MNLLYHFELFHRLDYYRREPRYDLKYAGIEEEEMVGVCYGREYWEIVLEASLLQWGIPIFYFFSSDGEVILWRCVCGWYNNFRSPLSSDRCWRCHRSRAEARSAQGLHNGFQGLECRRVVGTAAPSTFYFSGTDGSGSGVYRPWGDSTAALQQMSGMEFSEPG